MGACINRHFGSVGGFSTRRSIHQFTTVLPFSDLKEAQRILEDFTRDFQETDLVKIEMAAKKKNPSIDCFEFSIHAGLARGDSNIEMESIMALAEFEQKPIAQFSCKI
jgi:phospholipid/cholesterol/gamma-HCH transport system ATP-binding protein